MLVVVVVAGDRHGTDSSMFAGQACRWALIGNAVTVPVAKWLGERLMDPCSRKYYVGQKDCKLELDAGMIPSAPMQFTGASQRVPG